MPHSGASPDTFTVPIPRAGDAFELNLTVDGEWYHTEVWAFGGVDAYYDRANDLRQGYRVTQSWRVPCDWFGEGRICTGSDAWILDLARRDAFVQAWDSEGMDMRNGADVPGVGFAGHQSGWRMASVDTTLRSEPLWFLAGATLVAGETWTHETPYGAIVSVEPLGWTTIDGTSLFAVETTWSTLYYDGTSAFPALVHEWNGRARLASWTPGSGPVLEDEAYASPPWRDRDPSGPAHVVTRDGPGEVFDEGFPLPAAVAVGKTDPGAAAWFAAHPDAYMFRADVVQRVDRGGLFEYVFEYADGDAGYRFGAEGLRTAAGTIARPFGGGHIDPSWFRSHSPAVVGRTSQCWESAYAAFDLRYPGRRDVEGTARFGMYLVEGDNIRCDAGYISGATTSLRGPLGAEVNSPFANIVTHDGMIESYYHQDRITRAGVT